jgi:hypothetical protein
MTYAAELAVKGLPRDGSLITQKGSCFACQPCYHMITVSTNLPVVFGLSLTQGGRCFACPSYTYIIHFKHSPITLIPALTDSHLSSRQGTPDPAWSRATADTKVCIAYLPPTSTDVSELHVDNCGLVSDLHGGQYKLYISVQACRAPTRRVWKRAALTQPSKAT